MEKEVSLVPVPFPSAPSLPPTQSFGPEDEGGFGFRWKKAKTHYFQNATMKHETNPTGCKINVRPKAEDYHSSPHTGLMSHILVLHQIHSKQHDTLLL